MSELERQPILDEEHLRLLRIGYFITGGTEAFTALFGLIYVVMGAFKVFGFTALSRSTRPSDVPPAFVGWFLFFMGLAFTAGFGGLAILKFLTARALRLRRSRTLCLITAGLSCIVIPYGTAVGIFTFVVLNRPSVMGLFGVGAPAPSAVPPQIATPDTRAPGQGPVA
jgi:hypothetical protein